MSEIKRLFDQEWEELVQTIPEDLDASAKEHGALRRRRGLKSAADLLRLILIEAVVLSLRATAVWGVGLGVCDISRQALDKRILQSTAWLRHLVSVVLNTLVPAPAENSTLVRRVVLRDATVIARRGSPGTEWRLHLSWSLFNLQPVQVTMTDDQSGEGLEDAGLHKGDLVLADRAYGIWRTVAVVLEAAAYLIIRLTWSNLPLQTLDGHAFDLINWLQELPATTESAEITVMAAADSHQRPLRLVVGRLPPDKAAAARAAVEKQARKKNRPANPHTLLAAGFCMLLTNLPAATWSTSLVLAAYRIRWQIEWCFRRWKSLCQLDRLPAYPARIAEPLLLAKVLLVLLVQRRLGQLPWSDWWAAEPPAPVVSTVVQLAYTRVCAIIRPPAIVDHLLADPQPFLRHLRSSRRKRPLQLAAAARCFAGLLPGAAPRLAEAKLS